MDGAKMSGKDLLNEIIVKSGLPKEPLSRELYDLLTSAGVDPDHCTLEQLRSALADYLQDVLLASQRSYSK